MSGGFHELTVARVEPLTDEACAVHFTVPAELRAEYDFTPGQHLTLRRSSTGASAGQEERRTYSICSTPADLAERGQLRIGVKRITNGVFSGWLTGGVRAGDVVEVMTPAGRFGTPVSPDNERHVSCLAAGSGITPVLSIVASILRAEPASRLTLVYGNRTSNDVMFLEELADLKNSYPSRFTLLNVLSAEPQLSDLLTGRIDEDKVAILLDGLCKDVDEWYLCGPLGMVSSTRAALVAGGVPSTAVHSELFYVGDEPPEPVVTQSEHADSDRSQVTVTLSGRTSTIAVGYTGLSILDAVLANRPDAPYACKGGVCGTCRALVTAGSVSMTRNYALEPEELAAGLVLACQARPVTAEVSLQFQ
ncbi:MAG TPA: 1,2-phenylacetyl-CoA epoxidase subunit PaaE [Jatrophihabitans sp.]|uniref:1,2-phenylacetyl-CoA epoxidase subunit PaaE n=1 Tax=Jatrophihabitans sp. TaxID=1932789 RepID=UPI002F0F6690